MQDYASVTIGSSDPCPDCSGDKVEIGNVTFPPNTTCECVGTTSITTGTGVIIEKDAKVTFRAPKVKIQSGFHAKEGSTVKILQQAVAPDALTAKLQHRFHKENGTIVKIK